MEVDARPWRPSPIRLDEEPHAERRPSDGRSSDTEKDREWTDAQTRTRIQQCDPSVSCTECFKRDPFEFGRTSRVLLKERIQLERRQDGCKWKLGI